LRTIRWEDGKVILINQLKLPTELIFIETNNPNRIAKAIKTLEIRGAPAIGVAAAMALALTANNSKATDKEEFLNQLDLMAQQLQMTRPTAVNLFWAVERVLKKSRAVVGTIDEIKESTIQEALTMAEEDIRINKTMGTHGANLLEDGDVVGTICNAGWLATAGEYGTALGVIKVAHEQGKKISVIALETRPVLQGARLTAWELQQDGIEVKVIPDGAIGYCFYNHMIDKFVCGADRIVALNNCSVINKIGTHTVSIAAKYYHIPFYAVAPLSTFDFTHNLKEIRIEMRKQTEVTEINGKRIVPHNVKALNPAFDITPSSLFTAIITERGIIYPPFTANLSSLASSSE
jgi:methylthioribose-1-phosphate isomerase